MKLLICTQTVDSQDSNLGFFHRWIEEFSKHCEQVTVICLREGDHTLPANVRVYSLGKEHGPVSRVRYAIRFLLLIRRLRGQYDAVFVHMNPEYVLLGGFLWRRWSKRVGLWYAHRSCTKKLARAVRLVGCVLTVAPDSFPITTTKLKALGHGVDTVLFAPVPHQTSHKICIVTTGRVAASKHLIEMLDTLDVLHARHIKCTFTIVGVATSPIEEHYANQLLKEIVKRPYAESVHLLGAVPHDHLPRVLHTHNLFFNFGSTGNMDKAGLEALACGLPVITTNSAFQHILKPYGLYVPTMEGASVASAVEAFFNRTDRATVSTALRDVVVANHSLTHLIPKILAELH